MLPGVWPAAAMARKRTSPTVRVSSPPSSTSTVVRTGFRESGMGKML